MKVVQLVNERRLRGAEIFAAQLSAHLLKLGVDVHYVSLYRIEGREFVTGLPQVTDLSDHSVSPWVRWKLPLQRIVILVRLCRLLRKVRPDVVQCNAGDTLKFVVIARLVTGINFRIVFRNASTISRYLRTPLHRFFTGWLLMKADSIISVSDMCRNDLTALFPRLRKKTTVIPIGIDFKPFRKLDIHPGRSPVFVHVGGFSFEKNHGGLIRIFSAIRKRIPTAVLWLVGDGPLLVDVGRQVSRAGLDDAVVFFGAVDNPLDYIHSADMLVLPSIIEGTPAVLPEAFWCGTPVVVYDIGGIPEMVINDDTGWLVPAGDEQYFADKVIEVLSKPEERKRITLNARKKAEVDFDNRVISSRFFQAYESLIAVDSTRNK